ncbi:hypothetical protein EFK50_15380 [Nocardioides marmoriginsengisoli]|uniref:DUF3558 domain-containing protein n=1 Tax=Nocardioides marmoriginsengisoli TaxID=661483 RepID=A0A3N0CI27_9ACTN|nr:hypothetical protein [Nocardioides marmoriginsengisoli]RNL63092.1 hypothetical protein EFK50_15380 [Nocardioides marmoriginsengisoli]
MRTRRLVTLALVAVTVLAGCSDGDPAAPVSSAPRAIKDLDPASMSLVRVEFCDLVPVAAVRTALGSEPRTPDEWRNGDPIPGGGPGGIGHEFGCSWTSPAGRIARAWVFARPIAPAYARTLVRAAGRKTGCTTTASAFGEPGLLQSCSGPGKSLVARHAGLFQDTWLSCEVTQTSTRKAVTARADAWCSAVASALDTSK